MQSKRNCESLNAMDPSWKSTLLFISADISVCPDLVDFHTLWSGKPVALLMRMYGIPTSFVSVELSRLVTDCCDHPLYGDSEVKMVQVPILNMTCQSFDVGLSVTN